MTSTDSMRRVYLRNGNVKLDVYKLKYMGIPLYIKIQLLERAKSVITVVIAFKEDESAS